MIKFQFATFSLQILLGIYKRDSIREKFL